jgi:hypothetical protein
MILIKTMSYTTKTKWETRINYDNGIVLSRPSLKKLSVDIGLKIAGQQFVMDLEQLLAS